MRVSSPVGDFPFEARRLRVERDGVVVEGSMGAWPATIRVTPADAPMLLKLVPRELGIGLGIGLAALLASALLRRLVPRQS